MLKVMKETGEQNLGLLTLRYRLLPTMRLSPWTTCICHPSFSSLPKEAGSGPVTGTYLSVQDCVRSLEQG